MTDFKYDFSGVVSKYNTKCQDGRIIKPGAFADSDGAIVPVVWQHDHSSPFAVMGHCLLKDKGDALYGYISLNNSELGEHTRECVKHGDLRALSVFANHLKENRGVVQHGKVKEVSVVLAGANPGAIIDNVMLHSDEEGGMSAQIRFYDEADYEDDLDLDGGILAMGDDDDDGDEGENDFIEEPTDTPSTNEEPEATETEIAHSDGDDNKKKSVADTLETLNDEQRAAVEFAMNTVVAAVIDQLTNDEEETDMKHSIYDTGVVTKTPALTKEEQTAFLAHVAEDGASLRQTISAFIDSEVEATLAHDDGDDPAQTYGITHIDYLFPNARNYTTQPEFIKRRTEWVNVVMTGVHTTPFSKIKSIFADITADEARAKGYTKGDLKEDEVFELLTRETGPQTIYKRQKIDRDDRIDIIDFDVVIWIKGEMRLMWEEDVARAILVGDGRSNVHKFKIKEDRIRPIWTDASLYTVPVRTPVASGASDDARTKAIIRNIIKNRKQYKGSGNPVLFTTEDFVADCLLLTDDVGRDLYESIEKLATKLRVSRIVTVEVMEGLSRSVKLNPTDQANTTVYLDAILVNLNDYNVGADRGGKAEMFEDFDLDYNQYIYLYEGRCSGALVKPYSAMAIEHYTAPAASNQASG